MPGYPSLLRYYAALPGLMCALLCGCLASKSPALISDSLGPVLFAPGVISTNDVFASAFTPDFKEVYFVKSYNTRSKMELRMSRFVNGQWTASEISRFSNPRFVEIDPFISPDGKKLYFNSNRPLRPGDSLPRPDLDTWMVERRGDSWSEPIHLGNIVNSDSSDFYATVSDKGNMYFASTRTVKNRRPDIYVSRLVNGRYSEPQSLGAPVNTEYSDSNPYIARDESFIIFFSNRPGGFGDNDLYISFNQNGKWTEPQNLGPQINTAEAEFCPMLSPDGRFFFFSRSTFVDRKPVKENIYYLDSRFLKNLKK